MDLQGLVNVSGVANLLGTTTFRSTSTTDVTAGSTLVVWGETYYDGGLIDASGIVEQAGDAFVTADQTISTTSVFDWDGPLNDSSFTVENGREFHLTAGSLNPSHNVYNGYLSIHGGLLNVDVADDQWFLADMLRLISGVKGEGAAIRGVDLDVTGGVVAPGPSTHTIFAKTRFVGAGLSFSVGSGTTVRFDASVEFNDGVHSGLDVVTIAQTALVDGGDVASPVFNIEAPAKAELRSGRLRAGELSADGDFTMVGGVLSADVFRGDLVNKCGAMGPGPNPLATGDMVVEGDYEQNDLSTLDIQLASETVFGTITVVGEAVLDGRLNVELLGTYAPVLGDTFKILTAAAINGEFPHLSLLSLGGQLGWNLNYSANMLSLEVADVVFEGDYNDDGVVDAADYTVWRDQFGADRPRLPNEQATPGEVTMEDYDV
ncbi:hypothetical protein KOR34_05240 [Posidoniimonas corsicana]|uniref:Dockerin domain-containing protein n=1 Tax=Posidoniimonas corsicana TaxID=1938618 RepID=A0A5C5VC87_9BACT|nr:hypothetical protein [Posidoniimonas corsicana]TWT35630.1 hypothetical protein KOR34_05240 [Posidoniimonas corsicana]